MHSATKLSLFIDVRSSQQQPQVSTAEPYPTICVTSLVAFQKIVWGRFRNPQTSQESLAESDRRNAGQRFAHPEEKAGLLLQQPEAEQTFWPRPEASFHALRQGEPRALVAAC